MIKIALAAFGILFAFPLGLSAGSAPEAQISNSAVRVQLFLPDLSAGFYRGTRFDWSGVIARLEYAGHNYYPQWFERSDSTVHDFIYAGNEIVAGPCTAITGPAEEFVSDGKGLGFDEAKAGGTFIKIGVGVLQKPEEGKYDPFRLYPIKDGGKWTVTRQSDGMEFKHELADWSSGYAYQYQKTVSLAADKPELTLSHNLRNTGKRAIQTSVYNHNFLYLDRAAPSPDFSLTVPFKLHVSQPTANGLVEVGENQITFGKALAGEERVYLLIEGFGNESKDYDFRIENRKLGAGVRITADRPLSRCALWAIRAPLSIEPFIKMNLEPGAEFTWKIKYEYYTLPKVEK